MIDIKLIREHKDLVKANINKKFQDSKLPLVDEVYDLDKKYRELKVEVDNLRKDRNLISENIGLLMRTGEKDKAIEEKIEFEDLKEFKAIAGFGVEAIMQNNDKYLIGNRKLMTENGVIIPNEQDEQQLVNDGNSILFVSLNNKLVALIGVKDILKDNIEERVLNAYRINDLNNLLFLGDDFVGIEFKNLNQEEILEIHNSKCLL